jgi:hypothetical protein
MKAYGFMINGRGSGGGYDRKKSVGDWVDKCSHRSVGTRNALRAHKKVARRAGKEAAAEGLAEAYDK